VCAATPNLVRIEAPRYCRPSMLRQTVRVGLGTVILALGFAVALFAGAADASTSKQLHPKIHGRYGIYRNGSGIYIYSMRVMGLPVHARVTITCTHLCSLSESRTVGLSGSITITKFKKVKLRPGAVLAVRVTKGGYDGALLRLGVVGNAKTRVVFRQTSLCIPVGTTTPKLKCSPTSAAGGTTTITLPAAGPNDPPPPPTTGVTVTVPDTLVAPHVSASVSTADEVVLAWPGVTGAKGYVVYLDGTKLVTLGAVTTFTSAPLQCGTSHTLGVQATAGNTTSAIATSKITTSTCPTGPEPAPLPPAAGLTATFSSGHLFITWSAVAGAKTYHVYMNGSIVAYNITATTWDFGSVDCGRTFSPGVEALGQPGEVSTIVTLTANSPACAGATPDTTPPTAPTSVSEYFPSETGFTLGFGGASDDTGVAGYDVYVSGAKVASVAAGSALPSLGSLGYVVGGLACGTTYAVGVDAFDAAGNISPQTTVQLSTTQCAGSIAAPTGVVATVDSNNNVYLYWNAVDGNDGYYLWLDGARMLTVGGTSFYYGPLTCGHTYTLGVQTIVGGDVSVVATAHVTTNPC
jgi:hypothetical protein